MDQDHDKAYVNQLRQLIITKYHASALFRSPTETEVLLHGKTVKSLFVTGSTVYTVSHTTPTYLIDLSLQQLNTLLDIECADEQQLPYEGYIETGLQLPLQRE